MPKNDVLSRINKLIEIVRPYDSLAGRIARLEARDRYVYDDWKAKVQKWQSKYEKNESLYIAVINADDYPELPASIQIKLHGKKCFASYDATTEQIREAYDELRRISQ